MKFLSQRKEKEIKKIFPESTITFDSKFYYVATESSVISADQTKQLEKKRLRIESIRAGEIKLRRKLKVFDWFVVYALMRISIGVLFVGLGLLLL